MSGFTALERLLLPLVRRFVALWVRPSILPDDAAARLAGGQPVVYALLGDTILLGPTPDSVYTVSVDYYKRWDALTVTDTNWLLTNYPMVYLAGAMTEASLYLQDTDKVALWDARYRAEVSTLQDTDDAALRSGSVMRVRVL